VAATPERLIRYQDTAASDRISRKSLGMFVSNRSQMETILHLMEQIYDSVADSSRWRAFLEAFVHAVGGHLGSLAIRDSTQSEFAAVCWYGWSEQTVQEYNDRYSTTDPWRTVTGTWPEGSVGTDSDLCSREVIEASPVYRDIYEPQNAIYGLGGTILVTEAGRSVITVARGREKGPFGEWEKATLLALLPHLKRAALLHGELGSLRRQLATFTDHLNRYSHGYFITDTHGRVLYANAAGREAIAVADGLALKDGRLVIASRAEDATLRRELSRITTWRPHQLQRLVIPRPSDRKPYRLILMPVQASGAIPMGVSVPAAGILLVDSDSRAEPDVEALCALFSFTPAEARVVGKLALGRSVEEIAAEAGLCTETVRTHLKRALAKSGTERQGELISLVLHSVPLRKPQ
jgi:DNA-binding CsgD family transcriptional regulator